MPVLMDSMSSSSLSRPLLPGPFLGLVLGLGFSRGSGLLLLVSSSSLFAPDSFFLGFPLALSEDAELALSLDLERPDVDEAEFFLSRGRVTPDEDEEESKLRGLDFVVCVCEELTLLGLVFLATIFLPGETLAKPVPVWVAHSRSV